MLCLHKDNSQIMDIPKKKKNEKRRRRQKFSHTDPCKTRMTSGCHKVDFSFAGKMSLGSSIIEP